MGRLFSFFFFVLKQEACNGYLFQILLDKDIIYLVSQKKGKKDIIYTLCTDQARLEKQVGPVPYKKISYLNRWFLKLDLWFNRMLKFIRTLKLQRNFN